MINQFKLLSNISFNTLKPLLILLVTCSIALAISSCDEEDEGPKEYDIEFTFSTMGEPTQGDDPCCAPFVYVRQVGEGTSANFGEFTFISQFCSNFNTGEYFGTEDGGIMFTFDNGDQLFFGTANVSEFIVPTEREGYDLEFGGPPPITGVTGRFAGAWGEANIESYFKHGRATHRPRMDGHHHHSLSTRYATPKPSRNL